MNDRPEAMIINSLVRQAFTSAQEVMGDNGLNTVLHTCGLERFIGNFPPNNLEPAIQASQYAKFNEAIEAFLISEQNEPSSEYIYLELSQLYGQLEQLDKQLEYEQKYKENGGI